MLQDRSVVAGLNTALNEADVVGLRVYWPGRTVRLLLHVLALPELGPADPDTRRALIFTGVSQLRVLLRTDRSNNRDYSKAITLADADDADRFLASVGWSNPMYGWSFVDDPQLTHGWPEELSFTLTSPNGPADGPGTHTLYWFCECGRAEPGGDIGYCIEGDIRFERLEIERADGSPIPLTTFVAAGVRWWEAHEAADPRVSPEAQQSQPPSPAWT
ncbi:hypothetical protein Cs7R123_24600 [Catellatospora sp. TT07R-123]|uniref:hypothetical protein n=1 Tax=Catellatospora sp. TT07R-123 TaxID=2733863 RepID=UPI001B2BA877|nr:hypothetical protein [Catellatospora sp. TT07R-123]GHJ45118.1 hypothetical protein Cs7R123_24600 [Catellatospora sp. TT07R-123]